jgi:hypothetical protein
MGSDYERHAICGIITLLELRDPDRHASMSPPTRSSPPCQWTSSRC